MFIAMPNAAIRVRNPTIRPRPPKNSAAMARKASGAGMCMTPVKKPIVAEKPKPPNQPNIFCAPCAKKTIPSTSLRIAVAVLSSVVNSFRIICCSSLIVFVALSGPGRYRLLEQVLRCSILPARFQHWIVSVSRVAYARPGNVGWSFRRQIVAARVLPLALSFGGGLLCLPHARRGGTRAADSCCFASGFLVVLAASDVAALLAAWVLAGLYLGRDLAVRCHYYPLLTMLCWAASAIVLIRP